jgi:hypothetical protein
VKLYFQADDWAACKPVVRSAVSQQHMHNHMSLVVIIVCIWEVTRFCVVFGWRVCFPYAKQQVVLTPFQSAMIERGCYDC